jgi:hypothetical protein
MSTEERSEAIKNIATWAKNFVFPYAYDPKENTIDYGGIRKRELFAAMAMQGVAASGDWDRADFVAKMAVQFADALLAELEKPIEPKRCMSISEGRECCLAAGHENERSHESANDSGKPKRFWR